jgi:hypothetical protein
MRRAPLADKVSAEQRGLRAMFEAADGIPVLPQLV